MEYVLGIGEFAITQSRQDKLITHALGSCVGFLVYCDITGMAALAHIALPEPLAHMKVEGHKPAYFASEIVPRLLAAFENEKGFRRGHLHVHIIGGAVSRSETDPFQVGRRNVAAVKRILDQRGIRYTATAIGGHVSRTVEFCLDDSALHIKTMSMLL